MFCLFPQKNRRSRKGFTLVELLVYVSILVVLMGGSVSFLFSINNVVTQYRLETELYRGGTAVLEQIVLSLRQADFFDVGASVVQPAANGVLSVAGDVSTQFELVGGELQLSIDGVDYGDITTDEVSVTRFEVYHYTTAAGDFVRVEVDLTATIGAFSRSETFYGGSVLRGSIN